MAHPSTYTKKKNEILKLERRNKRYLKEYELKMVSTMCKSTDEDEQQGVKINKDGYQTHFKAKVSEKIDTEGNFENDKLDMEFKECMECMDRFLRLMVEGLSDKASTTSIWPGTIACFSVQSAV